MIWAGPKLRRVSMSRCVSHKHHKSLKETTIVKWFQSCWSSQSLCRMRFNLELTCPRRCALAPGKICGQKVSGDVKVSTPFLPASLSISSRGLKFPPAGRAGDRRSRTKSSAQKSPARNFKSPALHYPAPASRREGLGSLTGGFNSLSGVSHLMTSRFLLSHEAVQGAVRRRWFKGAAV